ncbi:hypothetical protein K3725_01425 [Leisingera sp. S132]|uniref:hypothetical protein n=1 Tax=Leisingera sp. S132 TaxID=2867016 RepID=UPI0021A69BCA|nr:hypothetical protein [Leisingera sp. S132]UWQ79697.1 hypothetical protein K3725_01425 [Leisingera sp. S132]
MTALSRVWIVGEGCGERAVSVRVKSTPANDRFDDMRCIATMGALRARMDAASAMAKIPMSGLSASRSFDDG